MLTLQRKVGQRFVIDDDIFLQIILIKGDEVTFTLKSPEPITVSFEVKHDVFRIQKVEELPIPSNMGGGYAVKFTRSLRQRFMIGEDILVKVFFLERFKAGISFEAPKYISILREEVTKHDQARVYSDVAGTLSA